MSSLKLLALDTSTDACSVTLLIEDVFFDRFTVAARQHTALILPMVDSVLKEAEISLSELDAFAFGRGPGSFTGVRIAASLVQGLAFGIDKPVIPISTLRALAQQSFRLKNVQKVCARLDARMQEIYWALFEVDTEGLMQPVSNEQVTAEDKVILPPGNWYIETGYPSAHDIAWIARAEYLAGNQGVSAKEALPLYIRNNIVNR